MENTVNLILSELNYLENPYFTHLHDGTFSKSDFVETQIQFFIAVDFFSRPMAALAAKIPTAEMRMEVIRNVWEEHGEGALKASHTKTFKEFLWRLNKITPQDIEDRALWPELRIFNTALIGVCTLDDYMTGIGTIGMIEYMFSRISSRIGSGVIRQGWLTKETIIHYDCHEVLDIKHADDFFNIVRDTYNKSAENKYYIDQGLWLGATLFNTLYQGLYQNCARRALRDVNIPHSRAGGAPC